MRYAQIAIEKESQADSSLSMEDSLHLILDETISTIK